MKKRISLLLLCALLLAGCAAEKGTDGGTDTGPADNGTGTESIAETETSVYDSLVTEDFGGYTFHMLNGVSNYAYVLLTAEELTGETINDAVYNRNSLVSDRLNVNLEEYIADWNETTPTVDAMILAGDNAYDIFFDESQFSMQYVAKGNTTDLRTTELQLAEPWWDAGSIETMSLGDRLYTDIAVAQNAGAGSVLVLSGETDQAMVDAAERKPDLVLPSVKELHELLRG